MEILLRSGDRGGASRLSRGSNPGRPGIALPAPSPDRPLLYGLAARLSRGRTGRLPVRTPAYRTFNARRPAPGASNGPGAGLAAFRGLPK